MHWLTPKHPARLRPPATEWRATLKTVRLDGMRQALNNDDDYSGFAARPAGPRGPSPRFPEMTVSFRRPRFAVPSAILMFVPMLAAGCGSGEGVTSYRVPKATERDAVRPAAGDYRLLGLIVPAENPVWFFKFSGPAGEIEKYVADFDAIATSVKPAPGGGVPEFMLPAGWKRGGPRGGFVPVAETLNPPGGDGLEVTVTQSAGGVPANLKRWVEMIGLKPSADDVAKYTRTIDASGVKVLLVDLRGPNDPATKRGPMMAR